MRAPRVLTIATTIATASATALLLASCTASAIPGGACGTIDETGVHALFDRWNSSLQTGDPQAVIANYASESILLPTLSGEPRTTEAGLVDYFEHFLVNQPSGEIDQSVVRIGCNTAVDTGLYTFTFAATGDVVQARYTYAYAWDGEQWLIASHHSSVLPEDAPLAE